MAHPDPNGEALICEVCSKSFTNRFSLRNHKKSTHRSRDFACELCQKKFKLKVALRQHMTRYAYCSLISPFVSLIWRIGFIAVIPTLGHGCVISVTSLSRWKTSFSDISNRRTVQKAGIQIDVVQMYSIWWHKLMPWFVSEREQHTTYHLLNFIRNCFLSVVCWKCIRPLSISTSTRFPLPLPIFSCVRILTIRVSIQDVCKIDGIFHPPVRTSQMEAPPIDR